MVQYYETVCKPYMDCYTLTLCLLLLCFLLKTGTFLFLVFLYRDSGHTSLLYVAELCELDV